MKRAAVIVLSLLTLAFTGASLARAETAPLTEQHIEVIRANCKAAQTSLQQLRQSDLTTRISRGRDYEQILRLMATFNSRVVLNKLDAGPLSSVTAEFEKQFRTFQRDYITYSDQLTATVNMRCTDQPVTFYDALNLTREYRLKLAGEIDEMNTLLDAYQTGLSSLKQSLSESGGKN